MTNPTTRTHEWPAAIFVVGIVCLGWAAYAVAYAPDGKEFAALGYVLITGAGLLVSPDLVAPIAERRWFRKSSHQLNRVRGWAWVLALGVALVVALSVFAATVGGTVNLEDGVGALIVAATTVVFLSLVLTGGFAGALAALKDSEADVSKAAAKLAGYRLSVALVLFIVGTICQFSDVMSGT